MRYAHQNKIVVIDNRYQQFIEMKGYLYGRLKDVLFRSFQNPYEYFEGCTAFSTQHKIKRREFERVLVSMDAGGWKNSNFNYLFARKGKPSVLARA